MVHCYPTLSRIIVLPLPLLSTTLSLITHLDFSHLANIFTFLYSRAFSSAVSVIGGLLLLYIIAKASDEKTIFTSSTLFTMMCTILAIICSAMVGSWAKTPTTASGSSTTSTSVTTSTYLGVPDSSSNALAWHVVLMVGGFFFSQILAVLSWRVFPSHFTAKLSHLMWHTLALLMMALGLIYIDHYKDQSHEARLTTMHSWLGIAGVTLFCLSYAFGLVMWGCKVSGVEMDMRGGHRVVGGSAMVFAAMAIGTGIINLLSPNFNSLS